MKLVWLFLIVVFINDITKIAEINQLKEAAEHAYLAEDYATAIEKYLYLIDSFHIQDEEVLLNLAHAYYHSQDTAQAKTIYQDLTRTTAHEINSIAHQQLGLLSYQKKELEKSLASFKRALKENPLNEEARYNYELVKKLLDKQKNNQKNQDQQKNKEKDQSEQQQDNQGDQDQQQSDQSENSDQKEENQDQQSENGENKEDQQDKSQEQQSEKNNEENQEQTDKEQDQQQSGEEDKEENQKEGEDQNSASEEENELKEQEAPTLSTSEKLEELNLTEEAVQMILNAMRDSEIQYIQQMQKEPKTKPDSGKPDW